ncbi:MAG: Sec-independent protein translocase subunit TatA [Gordonia amarae]
MGALSWWHWAVLAIVVIILFGSKKLPEAARGLGQSLRIFKSEVAEMQNDGKKDAPEPSRELTAKPVDPGTGQSADDVKKSA